MLLPYAPQEFNQHKLELLRQTAEEYARLAEYYAMLAQRRWQEYLAFMNVLSEGISGANS